MQKPAIRLGLMFGLFACVLPMAAHARTSGAAAVRPPAMAGSWYPGDAEQLAMLTDQLLDNASPPALEGDRVRALVAPHAGYRYSGPAAATAYKLVQGQSYGRVIVLGPAHRQQTRGLSISESSHYGTPLGDIPVDLEAAAELRTSPLVTANANAHRREHSIEMQLPLLQRALAPGWKLLPVLVGKMEGDEHRQAADLLRPLADADTLVVVSGDFTHYGPSYGYLPFPADRHVQDRLRALDMGAYRHISAADPAGLRAYHARTGITTCALDPLLILLELMPDSAEVTLLDYDTSGEMTGDFRHSVSYLAIGITHELPLAGPPLAAAQGPALKPAELALLHRLACNAVAAVAASGYGTEGELRAMRSRLPAAVQRPGAAFVTLKNRGDLRGCVGSVLRRQPLYRAVITNASQAARDPRFPPLQARELGNLALSVSVLGEPVALRAVGEFRVGRHGMVLNKNGHRAVFLPSVAVEQGWDREETLSHLSTKAGLAPDAWRRGAQLRLFASQDYPPADASPAQFRCAPALPTARGTHPASVRYGPGQFLLPPGRPWPVLPVPGRAPPWY